MTNKHGNDILGMGIKLLKIACPVISKSLAYVVNSSIDNGIVHDDWKKARVTPVYENEGEINDENNFRPISVISHIAKMIESFVSDQIIKYIEDHAFISIDQSAYLKNMNRLTVNKKKSAVMVIGSKAQLQSLNLDQFSVNLDSNKIEFVNKAKYLGLLVKDDLSCDDHI